MKTCNDCRHSGCNSSTQTQRPGQFFLFVTGYVILVLLGNIRLLNIIGTFKLCLESDILNLDPAKQVLQFRLYSIQIFFGHIAAQVIFNQHFQLIMHLLHFGMIEIRRRLGHLLQQIHQFFGFFRGFAGSIQLVFHLLCGGFQQFLSACMGQNCLFS